MPIDLLAAIAELPPMARSALAIRILSENDPVEPREPPHCPNCDRAARRVVELHALAREIRAEIDRANARHRAEQRRIDPRSN